MKLTVVYLTFRRSPRFEWFTRSLARELHHTQIPASELQVVVIDGQLPKMGQARRDELRATAAGLIDFEHHPPKPTIWQGPHRLTSRDFFAAANARNTAFCYSRSTHVAFADDLSVLLPGWLRAHLDAAAGGYVLCGSTCKNRDIVVGQDGAIASFTRFPPGQDSRIPHVRGAGPQPCSGQWLYGGTFSVPLGYTLDVNGQDEIHDSIGGEDYDFGIRLERAGVAVKIDLGCATMEDEDGHHVEEPMVRLDKPWAGPDGPYTSNLLLNRLQREKDRRWTLGNDFSLRLVRDRVLAGEPFPIPAGPNAHWADGEPLARVGGAPICERYDGR